MSNVTALVPLKIQPTKVIVRGRKRRILTAAEVLATPDMGEPWIINNMIPCGGRVMFYGQGSSYKTMFVFDLAVCIASGRDLLPGLAVQKPGRVWLVSTEATLRANRKRLEYISRARNVVVQTLPLWYCQDRYCFSDAVDVDAFLSDLQRIEPAVVILDPLVNFVGGDENSTSETEPFRALLDAVILQTGATAIILHHEGVTAKGRPRGSSAWHGWLDSELQFVKTSFVPPNGTLKVNIVEITATKMRDGIEDKLLTLLPIFDSALGHIAFKPYSNDQQPMLYKLLDCQLVCQMLKSFSAMTTTDLVTQSGLSANRVKSALLELESQGVADQGGELMRNTSPDGSRQRRIAAWRLAANISQVDGYLAIIRAKQAEIEEDISRYYLDPATNASAR